jgi:hypothetical protein
MYIIPLRPKLKNTNSTFIFTNHRVSYNRINYELKAFTSVYKANADESIPYMKKRSSQMCISKWPHFCSL